MIKLVDCTLRDGGHINKSVFGERVIRKIIDNLVLSKIDIIEIGFLKNELYNPNIAIFNNINQAKEFIKHYKNAEFSLMAQQDQYDVSLLEDCSGAIEHIRVSFHNYDFNEGINFAEEVIKRGYKCHINPINLQGYTDKELIDIISIINEVNPHTFTIVDTFGAMTEKDLNRIVSIVDHNLNPDITIGLHLHENLGLSFSLAQFFTKIKPTKRNISVDGSLNGMGRVPGNLNIELFMNYMNRIFNKEYVLNPIYDAIDDYILPIKKITTWGYSLPYALSAQYGVHRTYAEFLISKAKLRTKDIQNILSSIKPKEKATYNPEYIQKLYIQYLSSEIDDSSSLNKLEKELKIGRKILLIAPGSSIIKNKEFIFNFIKKNNPIIISINFSSIKLGISPNYLFFSNKQRLEAIDKIDVKLIITSNLIDYLNKAEFVFNFSNLAQHNSDNALVLLIELMKMINIKKIYLCGFDGFIENQTNYYSNDLTTTYEELSNKYNDNDNVKQIIKNYFSDMEIKTITKSVYFDKENLEKQ